LEKKVSYKPDAIVIQPTFKWKRVVRWLKEASRRGLIGRNGKVPLLVNVPIIASVRNLKFWFLLTGRYLWFLDSELRGLVERFELAEKQARIAATVEREKMGLSVIARPVRAEAMTKENIYNQAYRKAFSEFSKAWTVKLAEKLIGLPDEVSGIHLAPMSHYREIPEILGKVHELLTKRLEEAHRTRMIAIMLRDISEGFSRFLLAIGKECGPDREIFSMIFHQRIYTFASDTAKTFGPFLETQVLALIDKGFYLGIIRIEHESNTIFVKLAVYALKHSGGQDIKNVILEEELNLAC